MIGAALLNNARAHSVFQRKPIRNIADAQREVDGVILQGDAAIGYLYLIHTQRGDDILIVIHIFFLGNFAVALVPKAGMRLGKIHGREGGGKAAGEIFRRLRCHAPADQQAEQYQNSQKEQNLFHVCRALFS